MVQTEEGSFKGRSWLIWVAATLTCVWMVWFSFCFICGFSPYGCGGGNWTHAPFDTTFVLISPAMLAILYATKKGELGKRQGYPIMILYSVITASSFFYVNISSFINPSPMTIIGTVIAVFVFGLINVAGALNYLHRRRSQRID